MQGLGFSMCVRACMCACVYVYWFGWQDHFIIFLFLKNSNLKKNFFQRAPLSKANCCFSVYCHLSLLILPSEKRHACLVEGKKQMGWVAQKLGTGNLTQAWGDLFAEGQRDVAALSLAPPSSAGVHEVAGSALLSEAVETPFLLIFQNASIITEKGVIIGLLTETTKQNILSFPKKTIWKSKGTLIEIQGHL